MGGTDLGSSSSGDEPLRRRLAAPLAGHRSSGEHPDPELVVAHAAGDLPPEYALAITKHLTACDDGRCLAVLRDVTAGAAVARDALYGARREEQTDGALVVQGRQTSHSFTCDEALWAQFQALAEEEGCSPDWLINEAMK